MLTDVLAQWSIVSQLQQTTVVFRQLEFARGAQHALTFYAAQLADLDQEGFAILARRQLGTDQCARHLDAHARIRRTANNGQWTVLPHINLAHTQAVGIGMLHSFDDFSHHDAGERRSDCLEFFNLKSGHSERFSELLGAERWIAKFAQPGFRELHDVALFFCLFLL